MHKFETILIIAFGVFGIVLAAIAIMALSDAAKNKQLKREIDLKCVRIANSFEELNQCSKILDSSK